MLKLGRVGSSRGPGPPTKPHRFPRYALERVTTALWNKLSRPKEAAFSYHILTINPSLFCCYAVIAVAFRIFIQGPTSCVSLNT